MTSGAPVELLRPGLLEGLDVVISGRADTLERVLAGLGADVQRLVADPLDEDAVVAAAAALERATLVVCETGGRMRAATDPAVGLRAAVEGAWTAARAIVNAHLSPNGFGKVVLITPRPGDGADAAAAGAALENLARTTSVEWARLGIRVVTVRPRDATPEAAVAQCVAYLASPAGDYFSGCVIDLGAAGMTGI